MKEIVKRPWCPVDFRLGTSDDQVKSVECEPLVASLLLVAMPFVPSSIHAPSMFVPSSVQLLVVRPLVASLLLVAMPFVPSSVHAPSSKARSP